MKELRATGAWQAGLTPVTTLLSTEQLPSFREGGDLRTELDVRGKPGSYLSNQTIELGPQESQRWHIVADVALDHADVIQLDHWLKSSADHVAELEDDIHASEQEFLRIISSSDGLQCGQNKRRSNRHLSNTVFNVMRGGIPLKNYEVDRDDFVGHVANFNHTAVQRHQEWLENLPTRLTLLELQDQVDTRGDVDLSRLAMEYLPLAFSRRHGDPTRPWNRFSIELTASDGSTNLNYQGNWRDIFQNWEALAVSFPGFTSGMIARFVNATSADGYNPYRITKHGFEWEETTPEDPWGNIGYWGDHQIIYLLKLLEWSWRLSPVDMDRMLNASAFTHANIPYRIKEFDDIKSDPRATIEFDHGSSAKIRERIAKLGADGKLLPDERGDIHYVTLLEKLLTLSLAKLSNFVPDGGIWLNTQRPEWERREQCTCRLWPIDGDGLLPSPLVCFFGGMDCHNARGELRRLLRSSEVLRKHRGCSADNATSFKSPMDAMTRQKLVVAFSQAGSSFRTGLYNDGLSERNPSYRVKHA